MIFIFSPPVLFLIQMLNMYPDIRSIQWNNV